MALCNKKSKNLTPCFDQGTQFFYQSEPTFSGHGLSARQGHHPQRLEEQEHLPGQRESCYNRLRFIQRH